MNYEPMTEQDQEYPPLLKATQRQELSSDISRAKSEVTNDGPNLTFPLPVSLPPSFFDIDHRRSDHLEPRSSLVDMAKLSVELQEHPCGEGGLGPVCLKALTNLDQKQIDTLALDPCFSGIQTMEELSAYLVKTMFRQSSNPLKQNGYSGFMRAVEAGYVKRGTTKPVIPSPLVQIHNGEGTTSQETVAASRSTEPRIVRTWFRNRVIGSNHSRLRLELGRTTVDKAARRQNPYLKIEMYKCMRSIISKAVKSHQSLLSDENAHNTSEDTQRGSSMAITSAGRIRTNLQSDSSHPGSGVDTDFDSDPGFVLDPDIF